MKKLIDYLTWFFTILVIFLIGFFVIPFLPIPHNYKVVIVRSGSMEPVIHTGSIVVYQPADQYKKGEIIVFKNESAGPKISTIHRIVDVSEENGQTIYRTKGDANKVNDFSQIPKRDVYGKMLFTIPFAGYLISWGQTSTGFVVLVVLPIALLLYHEVHSFLNKRKNKKQSHHVAAHHESATEEHDQTKAE